MSNNQLVGLPTSIQRLTKLEWLYLDGNKLTELPSEIGDLRELRKLRVSNNQLVGLPTSIHRLTKLEVLYLVGNKLTKLPAEIVDLRGLRVLWVSQNPLTVDATRFALKLMIRGVHVDGAGEHSGYFRYLEVRQKNRDKIAQLIAWEREVSFFFFSYRGFREFEGLINHLRYATNCSFKINGKFLVRINSF